MFNLFKKNTPSVGSVLYRGTLPGRPEEFSFLEKSGIRIKPGKTGPEVYWSLQLEHPQWGSADLIAMRDVPPPPKALIDFSFALTPEEKSEAAAAGHIISIRCPAARSNVLRDRKNFLRFARAVMADDGLSVMDHASQLFWSRAMLDEELMHDADLDIEAVYSMHAVTNDDGAVPWLHSHGLAELGAFDFDILAPAPDIMQHASDGLRAIAFAIVEGELQRSTPRFSLAHPGGDIRMVPVEEFNKKAPPGQVALRDTTHPDHNPPGPPRAVVCDPVGRVGGLFGANVRISRFLSRPIDEHSVFHFSTAASDLMAERARSTLDVFQQLAEEFSDLELPRLVKLGYVVDNGGPNDREHLWFEVHSLSPPSSLRLSVSSSLPPGTVDATLVNQPFHVARLSAGQRATHPLDLLSEWAIMSPAGQINPRNLRVARIIRAHRKEIAEANREARAQEQES